MNRISGSSCHEGSKTRSKNIVRMVLDVLVSWWPCLLLFLLFSNFPASAFSEERILHFHSDIEVLTDGSMLVTEKIKVRSENKEIKRGIYRDFPTDYRDRIGNRYRVGFEVVDVKRDGRGDGWHTQPINDGIRVYMGRKSVYLDQGDYTYELIYRTNRQLGFFDDHDELYWNVTGNFWSFPIDQASARVVLPVGVPTEKLVPEAYTGPRGAQGKSYEVRVDYDDSVHFKTTRKFGKGEGLTIVVAWPKGYVYEPTEREKIQYLLQDNRSWVILLGGLAVLLVYYLFAWMMVGRDPEEGVIITRYEPPAGLTPATARFVERMGYDHKTFAAAVVNLAVKGLLEIREYGDKFTLKRTDADVAGLAPGERAILKHLFGNAKGISVDLKQKNHKKIGKTLKAHKAALMRNNEKIYFLRNRGWLIPGFLISIAIYASITLGLPGKDMRMMGLFMSIWLTGWTLGVLVLGKMVWNAWTTLSSPLDAIGAIFITLFSVPFFGAEIFATVMLAKEASPALPAALISGVCINILFHYLLKAPTRAGRRLLDQLEGFRQFLDVAERDEMNFRNPPEKTPELFEKYLPYALALGVEQHWMERFAGMFARLEDQGQHYQPTWYHGSHWHLNDVGSFSNAIGSSLSSAVASSSTAPGSSSGSGGGGSSGGGGGGGGGGGW